MRDVLFYVVLGVDRVLFFLPRRLVEKKENVAIRGDVLAMVPGGLPARRSIP